MPEGAKKQPGIAAAYAIPGPMQLGRVAPIEAGLPVACSGEQPGQGVDLGSERRHGSGQLDAVLIGRVAGLDRHLQLPAQEPQPAPDARSVLRPQVPANAHHGQQEDQHQENGQAHAEPGPDIEELSGGAADAGDPADAAG